MAGYKKISEQVRHQGFALVPEIYTEQEIAAIIGDIEASDCSGPAFRRTKDLFAIRHFLREIPAVIPLIFTEKLKALVRGTFGQGYFVVKSIYFDKPQQSNWFVPYHQVLMISVNQKAAISGFGPWSQRSGQVAVQPPVAILENNFTLRLHLDDTGEENGALKVIPGSHRKNIYRPETIDRTQEREVSCSVEKGGVMIMKPLLLHASGRSTNNLKRRVIHIEFSKTKLPEPLH